MSRPAPECLSRLPREGSSISEWTLDELVGLQGWTLADLAENRQGRLSEPQKARLLAGQPELFGLLHIRVAPKHVIEAGLVTAHEGLALGCAGMSVNGPSLKLEVGERSFFWSDEETFRGKPFSQSATVLALRLQLFEHWVSQRQRVRVYALSDSLVAVEPWPIAGV